MDPFTLLSFGLVGLAILSEQDEEDVPFELTRLKKIPANFTTDAREFFKDYEVWHEYADELWHVTTNLPAVLEEGLKPRNEVNSVGLGGGEGNEAANKISVTFSRDSAERIYEAMRLAAEVCRGKVLAADMISSIFRQNEELIGIMEGMESITLDDIWSEIGLHGNKILTDLSTAHSIEDEFRTPEQKYALMQKIEGALAAWHYRNSSLFENSDVPPAQPVGFTAPFESFKNIDPKKIGIVLVAARIGSNPSVIEHERELRFWPRDLFVVGGERPVWKYEPGVQKKDEPKVLSSEEGLALAIWAWKMHNERVFGTKTKRLPRPTRLLGSGSSGFAFETEDPDIIVRVGEYQPLLEDEDIAESGGVVKVFATIPIKEDELCASWREKVSTGVESFILRQFDEEDSNLLIHTLTILYRLGRGKDLANRAPYSEGIKALKSKKETKGLWRAIFELGLPNGDLSLDNNLGVTKKGKIVAYDY